MNSIARLSRVLDLLEQLQHLRLHRHVERRHRLVGDQQLGVHRQRARDADALALAAARTGADSGRARWRPCAPAPAARARGFQRLARAAGRSSSALRRSPAPTVRRGLSERYGSWKTICTRLRSGRSARGGISAMSSLPSLIWPALGSISRTTQRATVVLPEPDSPTMPSVSPAADVEGRRRRAACTVARLAEPAARRGRSWPGPWPPAPPARARSLGPRVQAQRGHRADQHPGVVVPRALQHVVLAAHLDQVAQAQHRHAVARSRRRRRSRA